MTLPIKTKKTALSKIPEADRERIAAELLEEYMEGGKVAEIAARLGISTTAGYALLLRHHEQGWKDAQAAKALQALEEADAEMANATDGFTLARGEKRARSAQWTLERLASKLYGRNDTAQAITPVIIQIANLRGPTGAPPLVIKALNCDTDEGS